MLVFFNKEKSNNAKKQVASYRSIEEVLKHASQSSDYVKREETSLAHEQLTIHFFESMIDMQKLPSHVLHPLTGIRTYTFEILKEKLYTTEMKECNTALEADEGLLRGSLLVQFYENGQKKNVLVDLSYQEDREVTVPEIEFSVFGSKESFIESVEVNMNLIRKRIPSSDLYMKKYTVGTHSKTEVYIVYCQSIANEENVQTVTQRIRDLEIDQIQDASMLLNVIEDRRSIFPQIIDTERPDRTAGALLEGKVALLTNGSPQALIMPVTALEFLSAFEDYFLSWQAASALRLVRLMAVFFSNFATPLYVAILTYHPEIIPQDLFASLVVSRTAVPFPPIMEALFLEVTIELLREAGARLPTKVGQTIGIVGGIVIGTAAVEAGLTSNVLLIIVALAALASFTIPIYRMGTTIRLARFPFIIAAQVWGLIAIALVSVLFLSHLLSLTSLGRPYMAPLYPFSLHDMKDSILRLPQPMQNLRPRFLQTKEKERLIKKRPEPKKDIDDGF
ncbi:spore germination protein [Alkalihalobacillus sp. LMS6]|uniref:spore germination protein n=1 Tax=Alkalihalobacillus sp. LMS6 TaxID=2924034 RepID=UPI0020D011D7|nr:spore germination protein [Alkalihalobacillus sp. LMS6]UTR06241.1 spore germination protein [Alkalihalobacillus sp. LMS6]